MLQSQQHAALLQRPAFQWLLPAESAHQQQQQQQQQSPAEDADETRPAPALPAEAWQVGCGLMIVVQRQQLITAGAQIPTGASVQVPDARSMTQVSTVNLMLHTGIGGPTCAL